MHDVPGPQLVDGLARNEIDPPVEPGKRVNVGVKRLDLRRPADGKRIPQKPWRALEWAIGRHAETLSRALFRPLCFSRTISTEMSAGLTPLTLEACPRLSGWIIESFSRASIVMLSITS